MKVYKSVNVFNLFDSVTILQGKETVSISSFQQDLLTFSMAFLIQLM